MNQSHEDRIDQTGGSTGLHEGSEGEVKRD